MQIEFDGTYYNVWYNDECLYSDLSYQRCEGYIMEYSDSYSRQ